MKGALKQKAVFPSFVLACGRCNTSASALPRRWTLAMPLQPATPADPVRAQQTFNPPADSVTLDTPTSLSIKRTCQQRQEACQEAEFGCSTTEGLIYGGLSVAYLQVIIALTFREIKPPVVGPRLPFVTTYSPSSLFLTRHVKTNFARLTENTALLRNHGVIAAYRKNKNLRDILVRAKLRPLSEPRSTRRAEFFLFRPWVRNPHNGDVFHTQKHSGPATKNCVYLIHCLTCEVQYVELGANTDFPKDYQTTSPNQAKLEEWASSRKKNHNMASIKQEMVLLLEKLQAAGYKPVLLLGKATKKSHVVQVFTPRCTLATFAEESLKKMGSIHEYICQEFSATVQLHVDYTFSTKPGFQSVHGGTLASTPST
ncbi:unnamed protein product [Arctogadus glacialis]